MADNPFGSPVAGLALEMAVRNQKLLENIPNMTENQRRLLNLRLQKYGGDLSQYESVMQAGYEPTVSAMRSQAESMRDYLVGLPELMAKAAKEGRATGGGGPSQSPNTASLEDEIRRRLNNIDYYYGPKVSLPNAPTADTMERMAQSTPRPAQPATGPRLRAQPTRRGSGPRVTFR